MIRSFQLHENFLLQDPVCTSPEELECVNKVNAEPSNCLKPCSGLLVNSFSNVEVGDMKKLMPILENYNTYKKITGYPSGENGK